MKKSYTISEIKEKMSNLKGNDTLKELKSNSPSDYYHYVGLRNQLKELKEEEAGKIITLDVFEDFKGLAIWAIKKISYRENGRYMSSIKDSLEIMANRLITTTYTYSNNKSLKSKIVAIATYSAWDAIERNLCNEYGCDVLMNCRQYDVYDNFSNAKLSSLEKVS